MTPSNNSMQRTALRAAADAERSTGESQMDEQKKAALLASLAG
jgi:hypothetical protein